MTGTNAAVIPKETEPSPTVTAGLTVVTPDLIQQLLEHDYLKLKIKVQVDELTNAKLTRWRAGLLGAASAAVVVLGYLGIEANRIVSDFNQKAKEVHAVQDDIDRARASVELASTRVESSLEQAKTNVASSMGLVSSSQSFLSENIKELGKVQKAAEDVDRRLNESEQQLNRTIEKGEKNLAENLKAAKDAVDKVNPYIHVMGAAQEAAKNAAEEARKAGTFEIVFLESNSNRTIVLSDYSEPKKKYRVKFTTNHIKARANVDVTAALVDGQEFPVQYLRNLTVGEVQAIENTPLQVEVSALRHHRQPFLHSFLILRVFSAKRTQPLVAEKAGLASAVTNQE